MYYLTGLPGWMRFGYSPGWVGQSPSGLGPGAEFLMSGQWPTPQMAAAWQAMQAGQPVGPFGPWGGGAPWGAVPAGSDSRLQWLKGQADVLQQQLELIREQIAELEKAESGGGA
jgi:hypothetical protein